MKKETVTGKTKNKLIFWLGTIMLLAGLSLIAFPTLQSAYYRYIQTVEADQLLEEIETVMELKEENENSPTEEALSLSPEEEEPHYPETLETDSEGFLEIPAIDLQLKIGYGVEIPDLKTGPGFYPQSGHPHTCNVAIAGHRLTYGDPFLHLNKLEEGNEVILYYKDHIYYYLVEEVFDTHNRDWSVIDPTPVPALTLTTCHPPGSDARRLIVRAYLEKSVSLESGIYLEDPLLF